jgi:hypothetical protein
MEVRNMCRCTHHSQHRFNGACEVVGCDCVIPTDAICATCQQGYVKPRGDTGVCYRCAMSDFYAQVDEDFAPLMQPIREAGIECEPSNTGGHVMCLWIDLPAITTPEGHEHRPYILFSDGAEGGSSCGLYMGDSTDGINIEAPDIEADDGPQPNAGWHAMAQGQTLGRRVGEWFVALYPALCEWVASEVTFHSTQRTLRAYSNMPATDVVDVTESWDTLPTLPQANVW